MFGFFNVFSITRMSTNTKKLTLYKDYAKLNSERSTLLNKLKIWTTILLIEKLWASLSMNL